MGIEIFDGSIKIKDNNGNTAGITDNGQIKVFLQAENFDNFVTVAKTGGQYHTIQEAIDSITDAAADNIYAVQVYPGTYQENIVLKDYVNLIGLPDRRDTRITAASGTLLTLPANEAHLFWIDLYMEATTDDDILIDATAGNGVTGFFRIENSDIYMHSDAAIKPKLIDAKTGTGLYLINDTLSYYMDNTSTTGTHTPVLLQAGNNLFYLLRSILRSRNGSASANIQNIRDESTGRVLEEICTLQVTCTHPSYTGTATPYAVYGDFGQNKQFNNVVVECAGNNSGTCYVCIVDSTSGNQVVNTSRNIYDIDGFQNNMRYSVATGDTIYSYFNRHITDMSDTKNGNLREIDVYNNDDFIISEKVGIGTNTPNCPIHIQGSDARIRLDKSGSGGDAWDIISNGTTGSLSFYNDDTSTTAATILPDGNVGIGTVSPSNPLEVKYSTSQTTLGDSRHLALSSTGLGTGNRVEIGFGQDSPMQPAVIGFLVENGALQTYGGLYLATRATTDGADPPIERLYIKGNGNVGIGTTSPQLTGHIYSGSTQRTLALETTQTTGKQLVFKDPNTTDYTKVMIGSVGNELAFYTGTGTEYVRIDDIGNVGIGTNDPNVRLDIRDSDTSALLTNSDALYDDTGSVLRVYNTSDTANRSTILLRARSAGASAWAISNEHLGSGYLGNLSFRARNGGSSSVEVLKLTPTGNVGIGITSPLGKLHVYDTYAAGTWGTMFVGQSGAARDVFLAGQEGFSNGFTVQYDGSDMKYSFLDGNVGVGTNTPAGLFQVDVGGLVLQEKQNDVISNLAESSIYVTDGQVGGLRSSEGSHLVLQARSTAARDIIFVTGTTPQERMTILDDGSVGIGTSSPNHKLRIEDGNIMATAAAQGHGRVIMLLDGSDQWEWYPYADSLRLYNRGINGGGGGNAGYKMVIQGGGNIGIGTASPQGLVDIESGGSATSALFVRATTAVANQGGIIHHQGTTYAWQEVAQNTGTTNGLLTFHYVNRTAPGTKVTSDVLTLKGDGKVGIGINAPGAKLDVNGDLILQNGVAVDEFSTDTTLAGNSDLAVPTEKAVKTYVDNKFASGYSGDIPVVSGTITVTNGLITAYTPS